MVDIENLYEQEVIKKHETSSALCKLHIQNKWHCNLDTLVNWQTDKTVIQSI